MPVQSPRDESRRTCSKEGIAHNAAWRAARFHWNFNQLLGKCREMLSLKPTDWDCPNAPLIPATRVQSATTDSFENFKRCPVKRAGSSFVPRGIEAFTIPAK